jgi:PAS domain S-box-containing protein
MSSPEPLPAEILEHAGVGLVVTDREACPLYANAAARRLLGWPDGPLDAVFTSACRDLVDVSGAALARDASPVARAIASREAVRDTVVGVRRHGEDTRTWLQVSAVPHLAADGAVGYVTCSLTDVSHARGERLASAAVAYAAFQSMSDGVLVLDLDGMPRWSNPAADRIFGAPPSELRSRYRGPGSWQLFGEDGTPIAADDYPFWRTRRTGEPCRDVRVGSPRPDGGTIWLAISTDLLVAEPGGDPQGVVVTFSDISAQVDAERALGASRALLQKITDALPGVLYQFQVTEDGHASFPFMSGQIVEHAGLTPEQVRATPDLLWSRVHPDDIGRLRTASMRLARAVMPYAPGDPRAMQHFDQEFRVRAADGSWRWLRAHSRGSREAGGVVVHGLLLDITDRKVLAEQLRAAQRQEMVGVLVSGIAHNFNNMLAAILPNLDRARGATTGDLQQEVSDAYEAALSASELVRQLMIVARRDEPPPAEPVDVRSLALDVARMCRRTFDQRIEVDARVPDGPAPVAGRRAELQQAILNLCINARDAVSAVVDPRIELAVDAVEDEVRIVVRDNGIGMSADVARRAGEPFFTTKPQGAGTGLGLATALGIVRDTGGRLTWASVEGRGTAFTIALPRTEPPAVAPGPAASPRPIDGSLAGHTVLVVDDEDLVRGTLVRMLAAAGARSIAAQGGAEALALLVQHPEITAALLDVSMPGMPGAEVLAAVHRHRPTLPVFMVSGWLPDPSVFATARGTIQKPFTLAALVEALEPID